MIRLVLAASALALCVAGVDAQRAFAAPASQAQSAVVSDLSAQQQRRARTRIRVNPQPRFWDYPRPGNASWPGPGAVRLCRDGYALEYRPSGTVLTPQTRCRWVRG